MANQATRSVTKPLSKDFFKSDCFIMLCMYFGTLLIHVLLSLNTTIFNLTPDEYSVTAIGAYLNGFDWSSTVSTGGYYGYFQGILYAPIFLLTEDPYLRYDLMIILNDIIMSFVPIIIYYLSRKEFSLNRFPAILFSLISGLYPCYMLLTKFTWNETLCNTLPWLFLLVAYKSINCESKVKKQLLSVLGGLILVAGYATHGRMLSLMLAGIVTFLLYFAVTKKRIFCFVGFFSSLAAGFVADKFIKDYFQDALWLINDIDKVPTNTIEKMLDRIFSMDGEAIANFFKTLIGHFFYFISATWGFGAICIVLISIAAVVFTANGLRRKKNSDDEPYVTDNEGLFSIFAFLAMGAVFAVSVFFKCTSTVLTERADTMIYGRYTEVFYPIAIYAAMLLIYRGKLKVLHSFAALVCASFINMLTMIFVAPCVTGGERMVSAMILGLMPMRYGEKVKTLPTNETFIKIIITTMLVLLVVVIIQLIRKNDKNIYKFISLPLAGLLIYTNVVCYTSYNIPQAKNSLVGAESMDRAISMIADSDYTVYCFNIAKERYVKAQFLFDDKELVIVKNFSALSKLEKCPDFIVAGRADQLNLWVNNIRLVGNIGNDTQLFACTEEAYNYAVSKGLALEEDVIYSGAEIPATANVSKTETSAVMPESSAVYTNYATIWKGGSYIFTAKGEGADRDKLTVTLTKDKGAEDLEYTVLQQSDGVLKIQFTVDKKTENVRFKLSNNTGAEVTIDSVTLERGKGVKPYGIAVSAAA